MKKGLLAILVAGILGTIGFAFAEDIWPWGADCGVTWEEIEGVWVLDDPSKPEYFEVVLSRGFPLGERLFEIRHFNRQNQRVGKGFGFWRPSDSQIESLMQPTRNHPGDHVTPYFVTIRHVLTTTTRAATSSCPAASGRVTVALRQWMAKTPSRYSVKKDTSR